MYDELKTLVPSVEWCLQKSAVMNISWGADNRAVDGASLALFSNTWKSFLEKPNKFLLHLR